LGLAVPQVLLVQIQFLHQLHQQQEAEAVMTSIILPANHKEAGFLVGLVVDPAVIHRGRLAVLVHQDKAIVAVTMLQVRSVDLVEAVPGE
jgi:hypothetical protein